MDDIDFTTALEAAPLETAPLLEAIGELVQEGKQKTVDSWMGRLTDALIDKKDLTGAVRVLAHSTQWYPRDRAYKTTCKRKMEVVFADSERDLQLLKFSGFDNVRLKASECMRRFETLRGLEKDAKIYDKTWGFGIVKGVDEDTNKVLIDFTEKPGHQMALPYAAENMDIVDDTHLLARQHADPDALAEMVKKDPAEVMRMAIRSFGSRPIPILQERLVPRIVPESRWKRFWDVARKNLKEDPLVIMPAKRSEAIVLLEAAKSFDDNWFDGISEERDMYSILDQVGEYLGQKEREEATDEQKAVLAERLGFCLKGSASRYKENAVRSLLLAKQVGIPAEDMTGGSDFLESAWELESFLAINTSLHARERKNFFAYMLELREDETLDLFEEAIHQVDYTSLNEMLDILVTRGREKQAAKQMRGVWNQWDMNVFQIYWVAKNMHRLEEWKFGSTYDLAQRGLANLESELAGEANRVQNQLRDLYANPDWIKPVFGPMDVRQRRTITEGVKKSTGWEKLEKNSVLGQIVKIHPEMEEIVSGRGADGETTASRAALLSFRTFAEMQAQYEKITRVDIPQNSKDIATAREFGDLRENFEYHAAKENGRLLSTKQEELARQLTSVIPTDFAGLEVEGAGIGRGIEIKYENGKTETYFILGEFDTDEPLGIISSNSRMAKSLVGSSVGDDLMVPSAEGEVPVKVEKVLELTSEITKWIGTEDMIRPVE